MTRSWKPVTVTLGVTCMLGLAGSVAHVGADTHALLALANGPNGGLGCGDGEATQGQAGTISKICQGAGTGYIGPQIGGALSLQGANVVGPAQINGVIVSGGTVGAAVSG